MSFSLNVESFGQYSDLTYLVGLVAVLLTSQAVYRLFLSPTASVPGPWWARLTSLPLLYATFKGYRSRFADDLLRKYNTTVVVIAPNQVHTSDEEAIKVIYDRKAVKTRFYANMGSWKGVKSTLGILDYPTASTTRNNLIKCFQNKNLDILSTNIDGHVRHFVDCIALQVRENKPVECLFWFRLLALDIVTDVLWAEQTNLLQDAAKGNVNSLFLRRFHAFSKYNALRSFIPGLDLFVTMFGNDTWKGYRRDLNDLDQTACAALQRWEKANANGQSSHERDVLSMLANLNDHSEASKRIRPNEIPAYLVEMLAAGSSTTSTTATLFCHEMALNPKLQQELHNVLRATFHDPNDIKLSVAQEIPLLRAAVRETMRFYPVIPGPLERRLGTDCPIRSANLSLPKGVIASGAAFTQSRREDIFTRCNEFLPKRWLSEDDSDEDKARLARMTQNWIPFGTGARSCPGSNLALNELHLMLAAVIRRFRVSLPHENDGKPFVRGHVPTHDHFTSAPQLGSVWLRFEEIGD
ncbi:benzoate 4-monooxygenase cytochrome P450 [Pseudozyma hubeiensis SY62]|uniref:Benzoate 4-monooxygenase cytochrome P450 n=1 Tax=Pseudozyma hubeiensis (strain SY62) TaxID=1305764 RepID=R9PAN4_PSEHS|nr:benzoate 4-monooxygenase cytochrome P450 [Pseudozyma hubeiensis SY62]GAC95155.1 benzoate 4-monooxygenase cytochrome P450 [Pseudozyma hubeiensis SY62]